ncbi:MAG: hypothetical protein JO061_11405 [Acidobacteriaceae bacterium]|nr:hypothetical protein [Acidobacteriaceae bacterium]
MALNLDALRGDLGWLKKIKVPRPVPAPVPKPPLGSVQIVTGPGSIGFELNGVLVWSVDEKWFAGSPALTFGPDTTNFRVELQGALYPGTSLSADFILLLFPKGASGTPMDMSMTLGGFHAKSILEDWLAGSASLTSHVHFNRKVCRLGGGALTIHGTGSATFTPSWQTGCKGSNLASAAGISPSPLHSDSFSILLLKPGDPSLRTTPKSKRCLIAIERGLYHWSLRPNPLSIPIGKLIPRIDLFSTVGIEAGLNSATDVDHTLAALSVAANKLSLAPGGHLTDANGKKLLLPLTFPLYVHDFEARQTFLAARLSQNPVWIRAGSIAFQIADAQGTFAFQMATSKGVPTKVACTPVLLQAAAPLKGVAARPLPLTAQSQLNFASKPGATPGWGVLASPGATQPRVSLPNFAVAVLRRTDLLSLEFTFTNLALAGSGRAVPKLVPIDKSQPAYIIVQFNSPQNIAEQTFLETILPPPVTGPPVQALAAGPSRLVFKAGTKPIAYDIRTLLDWKRFDINVTEAASLPDPPPNPQNPPKPAAPQPTETAIEAPWHLFISPSATAGFSHRMNAVTHAGYTELWHTRLGVKKTVHGVPVVDQRDAAGRKIRAIWTPGFQEPPRAPNNLPFLMPLNDNVRDQIVALSSDFTIRDLPPKSIPVTKLMLSSLGAWLDVDGRWNPPPGPFDLAEWRHQATMGRDNYVKVVFKGFLCPFGHRAVLVVITERKFIENPAGQTTAYLIQRQFIVVKQPIKQYGYLRKFAPGKGRNFPFTQVHITTRVTPNLDANNGQHFFPTVGGSQFLFHLIGTDRDKRQTEFTAPLVFVIQTPAQQINGIADYTGAPPGSRERDMAGQQIAFARSSSHENASLHTATVTFSTLQFPGGTNLPIEQPVFYPLLDQNDAAQVVIPALQEITGSTSAVDIKYYDDYVTNGFKKGGVFLQLVNPLGVSFGADKSGGVATPDLNVGGLSRHFGTVSGTGAALDNFASGNFDPNQYFGGITSAQLLGVIPLTDIIQQVADVSHAPHKVPKFVTRRFPHKIVTTLGWKPQVKNWSSSFGSLNFTAPDNPKLPRHLALNVTITTPIKPGATPQAVVTGHLRSFDLSLFNVVGLHFKSLDFTSRPGKKLDVTAKLGTIGFLGDLSFLNALESVIPSDGFSDPPNIKVTSQGVTVGYTLGIPSVGVGVFSIENISLGASLELSFIGQPIRFRFHFSERQHPFLVSVSLLGGGGFFGLEIGPDGVEALEASLEFGANVSIDLVVASANVHIMAGVYLKLDFATKASQLTGYLRAGGSASVLGLITISVEFYLGFTYYFPHGSTPCKIAGEASVTVEVDVLFFSASVTLSFRREFGDPVISFADLIGPAAWDEYCDAFAA